MINKFNKNYVFVKMVYLNKQPHETGVVAVSMKYILHAFSNKEKATKYISQNAKSTTCLGGQIITYQEALRYFGQDAIIQAIEMNEAIENLNR